MIDLRTIKPLDFATIAASVVEDQPRPHRRGKQAVRRLGRAGRLPGAARTLRRSRRARCIASPRSTCRSPTTTGSSRRCCRTKSASSRRSRKSWHNCHEQEASARTASGCAGWGTPPSTSSGPAGQKFLFDPFIVENPEVSEGARRGSDRARRLRRAARDPSSLRPLRRCRCRCSRTIRALKVVTQFEIGDWLKGAGHQGRPGHRHEHRRHACLSRMSASPWSPPSIPAPSPRTERQRALGFPIGYVLRFANGFTIYNTGDTAVTMDMKIVHDLYKPEPGHPAHRRFLHHGRGAGGLRAESAQAANSPSAAIGAPGTACRPARRKLSKKSWPITSSPRNLSN